MNKSVFITRKIPEITVRMLEEEGIKVHVYPHDTIPTQKQLIASIKEYPYDAVICLLTDKIDSKVFDAAPHTKLFASYTVGFDNIDIHEAKKRGVTVTNIGSASHLPVAEFAIALMLGLTTRMVESDDFVRKGKYKGWSPMNFIGTDLSKKVIGLIGTGAIGSEVARIAHQGFGAEILYFDLHKNEQIEKEYNSVRVELVDDLLKRSDIISLHVPLLESTHHLVNKEKLYMMKKNAFIVNTSRGAVIDEKALVSALEEKRIAGAALDVYEFEPKLVPGLSKLNNVILTPHIASARENTRNEMAIAVAQNIISFFEGKVPPNKVNA